MTNNPALCAATIVQERGHPCPREREHCADADRNVHAPFCHAEQDAMSALVVRSYRPEDAAGARSVLAAAYGPAATPASVFDWWNFGCPLAASGFQVAEVGGRIVGVQPMELFPYEWSGRRLTGAMLTGVVVHPEFRRRGLFSRLIGACEKEAWQRGADFITTMPNERSRPGFLKLGYREPGRRQLLLLPLSASKLARRAVRWAPMALARAFRTHVSGAPACCRLTASEQPKPATCRRPGLELEILKQAPKDLDDLNEADQQLFPGLRLARSRAWWDWRYAASPRSYQMLRLRDARGGTAGLVVTTLEQRGGLEVGYVVDWLARDANLIPDILVGALGQLKEAGAAIAASVVSSDAQVRALRSSGFCRVPHWAPLKRFFTLFKPAPTIATDLLERMSSIHSWHQTLGDWDNL
jgi:GNAT superfamily N-acetyltransferase